MTRRMIKIEPGTESWDAWLEHYRGSKTELVMVLALKEARPFLAWTEFPPEVEATGFVSALPERAANAPPPEHFNAGRDVEQIADRLEARDQRNEAELAARDARHRKDAEGVTAFERAAAAVQIGEKPKLKGLNDIGMVMIDDPNELRRGRKPKPLRAKLVNLRDDPIGQMAKRSQIEKEQLDAARSWQALHDVAASVGGSRGIDPSAMKVDGGKMSAEPITDVQMAAIKRLEQLDRVLGSVGTTLVRSILGDRMTIAQVADLMGRPCEKERERQTERERIGWRLRECLDTLVTVMAVEVKGRRKRTPMSAGTSEMAELSRYADNPPLYDAVRAARK